MWYKSLICLTGVFALTTISLAQQAGRQPSVQFPQVVQLVGKPLPDIRILNSEGKPLSTADLRGQHTVLVFGCLT